MKKLIILSNILFAGAMITGTTGNALVLNNQLPLIQSIELNNKEQNNISFTIIKERNASVAKAEKKAEEDAALKAQQESVKEIITEVKETNDTEYKREDTIYVNGITVYISPSVSDYNYNTFINYIKEMPYFLTQNINTINVIDNIENTYGNVLGVTDSSNNIYITSENISDRETTLYHEAGHCLDHSSNGSYRYSISDTWKNICASEWSNEGYYSSTVESFAEAISRYYVDGLNKTKSREAIERLINTGVIEEPAEFTEVNVTLKAVNQAAYIYDGPKGKATMQLGTLKVGETIQAIAVNQRGTDYKVIYNGQEAYIRAEHIEVQ